MKLLLSIGIVGIAGLIAFQMIGATIDENGILQEPFALLPISMTLIGIGFGGALIRYILQRYSQNS